MARAQNPNLEILMMAVDQLGELASELVFVGGCATGLLITDVAAPPIRITRDVDAIVQVTTIGDYHQFSVKLRAKGFQEDTEDGAPICRWAAGTIILDVMPTNERILGFGNPWYAEAAQHAATVQLPSGTKIKMISVPYFLITKLEAFEGRGRGDFLMSHDIEDIVAVIDGRPGLLNEMEQASHALRIELAARLKKLLEIKAFINAVAGHMPTDPASQARVPAIINTLTTIAEVSK